MEHSNRLKKSYRTLCLGGWAVVLSALFFAGCGGGNGGSYHPDEGSGGMRGVDGEPDTEDSGPDACDDRPTETIAIDKTFWHSGFRVTLGDAVFTPATERCFQGALLIDAEFYNRGSAAYTFDPRMLVTSDGRDYAASAYSGDIPQVPGERMGRGTLAFSVDDKFTLDDAALIIGDAFEHQAIIPVGENSPEYFVSLEVTDIESAFSEFTVGAVTFTITDAYVRADSPADYRTFAQGDLEMVVVFDGTYNGGAGGGAVMSMDNVLLDLPDGTSVAPTKASVKLLSDTGATYRDLSVRFKIPQPVAGEYALVAGGYWLSGAGYLEGELPFQVPHLAAFGE